MGDDEFDDIFDDDMGDEEAGEDTTSVNREVISIETRRKLEEKLELRRLQKQIQDYDFDDLDLACD
ncbi:MAG TPA: hypothetical protein DCZ13_08455 [Porticoccaceae bacterium]|nr:hypothetical protein [Porticoccaceae bacterium]